MRRWITRWDTDRVEKLRSLAASNLSSTKIGCRLGISKNAVIGAARRHNVKLRSQRHQPWTDADRAALLALRNGEGWTFSRIAKQLGRKTPAVTTYYHNTLRRGQG
jgi:hypothetical protein